MIAASMGGERHGEAQDLAKSMSSRAECFRPRTLIIALLVVSSAWFASASAEDLPAGAGDAGESLVIGVGLVVGLPGTGDRTLDEGAVEKSIVGVLRRAGLDPWRGEIQPRQVAKVIVTAEMSPQAKPGAHLVITVTAVGDATSLAGGTLLPTPLRDTSGTVYAVGQGQIAIEHQAATVDGRAENLRMAGREVQMAEGGIFLGEHIQALAAE